MAGEKIDEAYVEIGVRDGKLDAGLRAASSKTRGLEAETKTITSKLGLNFATLTASITGAVYATNRLYNVTQMWIREAVKEAAATRMFAIAMGESATAARAFADSLQSLTGADLEDIFGQMGRMSLAIQNLGIAEAPAETMTEILTRLGYSIANVAGQEDASPILEALQRGIMGVARGLKAYGIPIDEAAVKQRGLEMGLASARGEMDEAGTALATFSLIIERATKYNIDFNSSVDQTIRRLREEKTAWGDLWAAYGRKLEPLAGARGAIPRAFNPETNPGKFGYTSLNPLSTPATWLGGGLGGRGSAFALGPAAVGRESEIAKRAQQAREKETQATLKAAEETIRRTAQTKRAADAEKTFAEETEKLDKQRASAMKQLGGFGRQTGAYGAVAEAEQAVRDRNLEVLGKYLPSGKGKYATGARQRYQAFMEARGAFQEIATVERTQPSLGAAAPLQQAKQKAWSRMAALGGEFFGDRWQEAAKPQLSAEEKQLQSANDTLTEILGELASIREATLAAERTRNEMQW